MKVYVVIQHRSVGDPWEFVTDVHGEVKAFPTKAAAQGERQRLRYNSPYIGPGRAKVVEFRDGRDG